ncbi:MAG: HdeD family acid-resistance protein [Bacteroidetes bacterium]|nr:MAG: HdeD family acid-resistance protein [Bacteroidota bacterium]
MIHILAKHWWVLVVRGLVSLIFAATAFLIPELTFAILVTLIGIFLLADGILATYSGWRLKGEDNDWWVAVLEGLIGVGLGIASLAYPDITAALLVLFIALWCLLTGAFEIALAIRIRKEIQDEWQLAFAGIISIALGVLMLVQPSAGAISIAWWVGFYAMFFGLLLIGLGIRLRRWLPSEPEA